ncbi:hypothetical protein FACS18949_01590 [Clostridia bacterium]|nr:hypothetical protein FACS18949_01590 [Clostridia bacterium]
MLYRVERYFFDGFAVNRHVELPDEVQINLDALFAAVVNLLGFKYLYRIDVFPLWYNKTKPSNT